MPKAYENCRVLGRWRSSALSDDNYSRPWWVCTFFHPKLDLQDTKTDLSTLKREGLGCDPRNFRIKKRRTKLVSPRYKTKFASEQPTSKLTSAQFAEHPWTRPDGSVSFGVGGSGRSPLESADPRVRRAGRRSKQYGMKQ